MGVHFVAGLVDGFQQGAGQFELSSRFERNRAAVFMTQGDRVACLQHGFPAEPGQSFEQRPYAPLALVRSGPVGFELEHEFFVLSADPPGLLGLAAGFQRFDELGLAFDRVAAF